MWRATDPRILIEGPAGTGKTLAVCAKSLALAGLHPGLRVLWVRKTRHSMTESVLQVFESGLVSGTDYAARWRSCSRAMRQSYEFPNGSSIVVAGLDHADRLMSTEFDLVCVFEATECRLEDYEKVTSRVRLGTIPLQQVICECNPEAPTHWLNQLANDGLMRRIYSRHQDNPRWWNEAAGSGGDWTSQGRAYVLGTLGALTGPRRLRLLDGRWCQAEGVVYDGWDPLIHPVDRFEIPSTWRRIRSLDFGLINPFVCQWWAIDNDGRMFLYRETYKTKVLTEDHARQIVALSAGEKYEASVADHDASERATLERHGVLTTPAKKDIKVGIQAVQARLRKAADGRPRLRILRDSLVELDRDLRAAAKPTCTGEEFDSYVWPKGVDGKPMKEEPVDADNHGMDALRYAVMYADRFASGSAGSSKVKVYKGTE